MRFVRAAKITFRDREKELRCKKGSKVVKVTDDIKGFQEEWRIHVLRTTRPDCQLHVIFIDQRTEDTDYDGKRRLCSFGEDHNGSIL
jgi:hypothetical protein